MDDPNEFFFLLLAGGLMAFVICVKLCGEALGMPRGRMILLAIGAGIFAGISTVMLAGYLGLQVFN